MSLNINGTDGISLAGQFNSASTFGMKNRIINGAMVIDQRNAGASVTQGTGTLYTLDRFACIGSAASKFTVQQSTTAPTGFKNSLLVTSLSAYTVGASERFGVWQIIEGFNVADLGWGTASAATVTLSFQVRSSLTGQFGGVIYSSNRYYPFSYTISAANTWETKSITITGSTDGTWATDNSAGMVVYFNMGAGASQSATAGSWGTSSVRGATGDTSVVGTNGATFYITGVQLEKGSTATSFDYRPYSSELAMCQRYYYRITSSGSDTWQPGWIASTTQARTITTFPVQLRTPPTALETSGTAADYAVQTSASTVNCNAVPSFGGSNSPAMVLINWPVASGLTAGQGTAGRIQTNGAYLGWSAEL